MIKSNRHSVLPILAKGKIYARRMQSLTKAQPSLPSRIQRPFLFLQSESILIISETPKAKSLMLVLLNQSAKSITPASSLVFFSVILSVLRISIHISQIAFPVPPYLQNDCYLMRNNPTFVHILELALVATTLLHHNITLLVHDLETFFIGVRAQCVSFAHQ